MGLLELEVSCSEGNLGSSFWEGRGIYATQKDKISYLCFINFYAVFTHTHTHTGQKSS